MKACPCLSRVPRRYFICVICFFGVVLSAILRYCISIAITEMVKPQHANHPLAAAGRLESCPHDGNGLERTFGDKDKGEFSWDEPTQGLVLSSFFWGYGLTQVPAGSLAERVGAKYTLAFAVLLPALCTLATPLVARLGGAWGIIGLRVVMGCSQGFFYPSINTILAKWVAVEERGRLGSLVYAGVSLGNVLAMSLSGLLLSWTDWTVLFYVYGTAGLLWLWVWLNCGYSRPEDHPGLTEGEKRYLDKYYTEVNMKNRLPPTPWSHILRSVPLWGLVVAQMGHDWGAFTIITEMPKYMKTVLHFSIAQTGLRTAALYVAIGSSAALVGALVDILLVKGVTSVTTSRKLFSAVSFLGPAVGMVAASLAGCDQQVVTLCLVLGMGMMGCFYPSITVNCLDLSPNYAGTVMALVNGIGALSGIISPYLTGLLIHDNTLQEWRTVFLIAASALVLTTLIYVCTASGEVQYWNDLPSAPESQVTFQSGKEAVTSIGGHNCSSESGFVQTTSEDIQIQKNRRENGHVKEMKEINV